MRRARLLIGILLAACAVALLLAGLAFRSPSRAGPDFDPAVLAAREATMWQAYYDGQPERVALELVAVLREQFGLSYAVSTFAARDFAEAAKLFRQNNSGYETKVLPPLARGYDRIRRATRADWDARAVAQAELAWWVARRTPGRWNADSVGDAIAQLYVLLYDIDPGAAARAGRLRAEAAQIRFYGAYTDGVDWEQVREHLTASYRELRAAIRSHASR